MHARTPMPRHMNAPSRNWEGGRTGVADVVGVVCEELNLGAHADAVGRVAPILVRCDLRAQDWNTFLEEDHKGRMMSKGGKSDGVKEEVIVSRKTEQSCSKVID